MTIAGWYERAGEFIARRQKDESSLTLLFRFLVSNGGRGLKLR